MKIAVGMSGGVDSSVAAKMLKDEGHEVVGLFLKLWSDPECKVDRQNRCCDYEALEDARAVAGKLKIPFYVINVREEFKKEVVDYFLQEYSVLRTPNPCIVCNDKIKFDLLLNRALSLGCDYLATGHYARILNDDVGYHLFTGVDKEKDQSYMLYRLSQYQLSKILFPLGGLTKKEVRAKARDWDLPVKEKPESQEICFVGEKDYRVFLRRYLGEEFFKPGEIVDTKGKIIGYHEGLINYTIGQRKGIEQIGLQQAASSRQQADRTPLYVVGFDVKKNQLIVGEDKEVYSKKMLVGGLTWISENISEACPEPVEWVGSDSSEVGSEGLKVKIRYRHPAVRCNIKYKILNIKNKKYIRVLFREPQRAVTPGQSAVFYMGEEVLGGGIIVSYKSEDHPRVAGWS